MDKRQNVNRLVQALVHDRIFNGPKTPAPLPHRTDPPDAAQPELEAKFEGLSLEFTEMASEIDDSDIIPLMLQFAQELVPAEAYAIWAFSRLNRQWRIADSVGLSETYKAAVIDARTVRDPVMPREPVVAAHVNEQRILEERQQLYQAEGIESLLVMPLAVHGGNNATIAVYSRHPRQFNAHEVESLSLLATLAAPVIEARNVFVD